MSATKIRLGNASWIARIGLPVLAAVALLTSAQPARSALVVRPVNTTLDALNFEQFNLDVDQNGTTDFIFSASFAPDPFFSLGFDTVDIPFASGNGVVIDTPNNGFPDASRLMTGDTVSAASQFSTFGDQGNLYSYDSFAGPSGNFGGQTGFLGLRFDNGGSTFLGFAQISINAFDAPVNPLGLTIGTVGYNDIAGQPVRIPLAGSVPEPGSLALLGAGAIGFLVARKKSRKVA